MRAWVRWAVIAAAAASLVGCAAEKAYRDYAGLGPRKPHQRRVALPAQAPIPTILVSIDGFRADYLDRGLTPHLKALADGGARAERMLPSFPSITFPNHYTLVTGKVPDHNGIVNNTFEDATLPEGKFRMGNRAAVRDEKSWDEATPIWVTAERAGIKTAPTFWPGSEAAIQGVRPTYWMPFDESVPSETRVDKLLAYLDLPLDQRPQFLTLYFDVVDTAGHDHGPDSPELSQALGVVDQAVGRLVAGLEARGLKANLVIVADHGMAATPLNQRIYMDDWTDPAGFRIVTAGAVAGLAPVLDAAIPKLLARHDHAACYRKSAIPKRLNYGANPRIPPIVCIAEPGWLLTTHERATHEKRPLLGEHGYDPADPTMGALFIANGPKVFSHVVLKPFPNTDVYGLLARLIDVTPEPYDGHVEDLYSALR
jgi:predicted AlkP superfamily pyrophosphatase or phosphodiesterase